MAIDKALLDALGYNWMVRVDKDGRGYGGFQWAPVGEWTECPRWSVDTVADYESGGLFGHGPGGGDFRGDGSDFMTGGFGVLFAGARFVFCETGPERMVVDPRQVKVRRARILYVGEDAMAALNYVGGGWFPGQFFGYWTGLGPLPSCGRIYRRPPAQKALSGR